MEVMFYLRRYVNHATRRNFIIHVGDGDFASTGNDVIDFVFSMRLLQNLYACRVFVEPRLIEATRKNSL